ncbi:pseudouridine synthase [Neotabrizicola sp. sgz301269]|uniref:pseudouridine synthase n=1 Tax=Neotabrizicola sp. sgz301269 TaxID=3276282 RepID=UPI00376F8493
MADKSTPKAVAAATPEGERIAKVLSRRGIASRREAERLIEAGEVTVNGKRIDSPALNVTAKDRITVSGQPLPAEEPARLWLYYKPEGLVTSASDEKGRDTVFDHLPEDMPRVMSVGRLDLNSEGLLLLTNDGELKRRLELPSTGWLRKYRVRVNGNPVDPDLDPLRKGIVVDGEKFQPMHVVLDRVQGANAWLTVGLREGKNREIRRAMNAIGLYVNRLIRTSYGPFRLGELQPGEVEEVRPKVLRDQLGLSPEEHDTTGPARPRRSSHKVPVRSPAAPGAKPGPRGAGKPAVEMTPAPRKPLPKPQKPGDGVRMLSSAWKEAVRPRLPGEEDAAPARKTTARPARSVAAGAAKPATKPYAKAPAKPAEKPATRPPAPGKPSSRKPATRNAPTRNAPAGGPRRK